MSNYNNYRLTLGDDFISNIIREVHLEKIFSYYNGKHDGPIICLDRNKGPSDIFLRLYDSDNVSTPFKDLAIYFPDLTKQLFFLDSQLTLYLEREPIPEKYDILFKMAYNYSYIVAKCGLNNSVVKYIYGVIKNQQNDLVSLSLSNHRVWSFPKWQVSVSYGSLYITDIAKKLLNNYGKPVDIALVANNSHVVMAAKDKDTARGFIEKLGIENYTFNYGFYSYYLEQGSNDWLGKAIDYTIRKGE